MTPLISSKSKALPAAEDIMTLATPTQEIGRVITGANCLRDVIALMRGMHIVHSNPNRKRQKREKMNRKKAQRERRNRK
jgi:hypothetical protein